MTYWPLLLLLHAPRLAQSIALVIAKRVRSALDHRIPDDLPQTAGEWLAARLAVLRIGVDAVVTDKYPDAYDPRAKLIQLRDTTYFKPDPVYWATAAHELGHARIRAERPVIGWLRRATNIYVGPLFAVGVASITAYMLSGSPLANHLAFACFAVAAALHVFVLLDEALASIHAYRELRGIGHRGAILAVLTTSFFTYLATYGSYALLLTQWSLLDAAPPARAELTVIGWIVAVVLSLASIAAWLLDRGPLRWLPIMLLLPLVWNVIDPAYAWCVIAAVLVSAPAVTALVHLPFAPAYVLVDLVIGKFRGRGIDETARYRRLRALGDRAVAAGNARLEARFVRRHPAWRWLRLGYLPLLVAIWL